MEQFTKNSTTETDDILIRKVWSAPRLLPIDIMDVTKNQVKNNTDGSGSAS